MKSQQDNPKSQEDKKCRFAEKAFYAVLIGIGLFVLLRFLLFEPVSAELTCSRSSQNSIACTLVRTAPLRRMSPIQILDPVAVDVITHQRKRTYSYSVEIRAANVPDKVPILSTYNYDFVQVPANKVNDFLLRSDAASFHGRFPEKTG